MPYTNIRANLCASCCTPSCRPGPMRCNLPTIVVGVITLCLQANAFCTCCSMASRASYVPWSAPLPMRLQCSPRRQKLASGAVYVRHCMTALQKHVLPRFLRPGPVVQPFFHSRICRKSRSATACFRPLQTSPPQQGSYGVGRRLWSLLPRVVSWHSSRPIKPGQPVSAQLHLSLPQYYDPWHYSAHQLRSLCQEPVFVVYHALELHFAIPFHNESATCYLVYRAFVCQRRLD